MPRAATTARGPSLAVGAAGTVYLAWTVGEDRAADIRVATSRDHGRTFGPPRIVGQSDGHADAPKLAVVNSIFKRGETSHIWLIRGQAAGH